jgi:hypothetical protein
MSRLTGLTKRLNRVQDKLHPPQKETRLPTVYLDPDVYAHDDPSTWRDYPGCEAHNQEMHRLAHRRRIEPKILGVGPDENGCEP